MEYQTSIDIAAPADRVWAAMSEVDRWPEWLPTVSSVHRLDAGPLAAGSRTRIKQPRLATMVWTVTQLEPGVSFTWAARAPGLLVSGSHALAPGSGGTVRVTLGIRQTGLLAGLIGLLYGGQTRRYVDLEALNLKRRCEE